MALTTDYTNNILKSLGESEGGNSAPGRDRVSSSVRVIDSFDWRSYYSSSDVRFEFDGVPVEEITSFNFRIVEPVKHHYGYNSYVRLAESRGSRMIHGSFSANFTDPIQLFYLLDKIKKGETPDSLGVGKMKATSEDISAKVKSIVAQSRKEGLSSEQVAEKISALGRSISNPASSKAPIKILEAYRDSLWGVAPDKDSKNPLSEDMIHNTKYESKRHGFNIRVIYGEPGANNTIIPNQTASTVSDAGVRRQVGAIRLLRGVQIMGEGQEISPTGEAIQSVYEFIAAEIN
jgi:hypothetical protein